MTTIAAKPMTHDDGGLAMTASHPETRFIIFWFCTKPTLQPETKYCDKLVEIKVWPVHSLYAIIARWMVLRTRPPQPAPP
jgi:hypothetical protein